MNYLCSHCHAGILEPHKTLNGWTKCPICAFCKEIPNTKKEIDGITGNDTTRK